jgi:hypothetical protein
MVAGIDFGALLADPNFQQGLGNAGQVIGNGGSFAEALNPSALIAQIQQQKATGELLKMLSGRGAAPATSQVGQVSPTMDDWNQMTTPTPKGMPGPDSVVTKRTADGTTTTIATPSKENLSSFGTSVPAEAQPKTSGLEVGSTPPFFQALLG